MSASHPQTTELRFVPAGNGGETRRIAVLHRPGDGRANAGPPLVWLGGFRSDMRATKAEALDAYAARTGRDYLRFDYTGHGETGGDFAAATISVWLEDTLAVLKELPAGARPILVGSSMGGWLALLATRALREAGADHCPGGLVLIAPAVDFTEALMWRAFPENIRHMILTRGAWMRPSAYAPEPTPITRTLIEDGRQHLLFDAPILPGCPVHILQGMQDPDVPWEHAMTLVEHLPGDQVTLTLIKDGDHRLSRPEDIERIVAAVDGIV